MPTKFNWYTWFAVVLISKAAIISPENPHPAGMKTITYSWIKVKTEQHVAVT